MIKLCRHMLPALYEKNEHDAQYYDKVINKVNGNHIIFDKISNRCARKCNFKP